MGGFLLIHGGKNPEGRNQYDDFNLFDFGIDQWVPVHITSVKSNQSHSIIEHENSVTKSVYEVLGSRYSHCMTVVFDK